MAATVVGSSWIDAVFKTTSLHSSFDASPGGASRAISCAARIPIGVAALPRPSRFALTFAESGCKTASCRALSGNRRRSIGLSACDSASASPEALISSITAHHRQTAPPITMHNSMAACAPSSAACCTCPTVPFRHPKRTETTIIAVHIRPISMTILLVFPNTC